MKPLTNLVLFLAALAMLAAGPAHAGKTVETIKARGHLVCGVNTGLAGFAAADSNGRWSGLDVDVCRAIAAAVLGDAEKVRYVPLTSQARFTALQSGDVDLLSRNTTFTLTRDASLGLSMTVVTYYDGQGFMVPVKNHVTSAKQLKNQTVCVQAGTTTEKNLTDYSRANNLNLKPVVFEKLEAATGAYFSGRCSAYTTDASGLASVRNKEAKIPADHVILPELISKEPLGPMVRRGDDEWFAIVKWVIYGLQEAEEYGVTRANVDQMAASTDPVVQRLLSTTDDTGKLLGLDKAWLANAIKATGNYGEIFERNVGPKSVLGLPRGINNLWSKGGVVYPIPIRSIAPRTTTNKPFNPVGENQMQRTVIASALVLVAAACSIGTPLPVSQQVPENLNPGADEVVLGTVGARGVQIYECRAKKDDPQATEWVFVAPEADLFRHGQVVGKHYAGPHWESTDGSKIAGSMKARADAPQAGAIPWLLLTAKSDGPEGTFAKVTSVQRINTEGGAAPAADDCKPESTGRQARVAYSADYVMFGSGKSALGASANRYE